MSDNTTLHETFTALDNLYAQLPDVSCHQCGSCCVSPTCTLAEFLYFFKDVATIFSEDEIRSFLTAPVSINTDHEGNLDCLFLKDKKCRHHAGRSGACRLFGIPSLEQFGVEDLVVCKYTLTVTGKSDTAFIKSWLDNLMQLNLKLYPVFSAPYFLTGLNLESWLDMYFDETLEDPILVQIQKMMHQSFDIQKFRTIFRQRTGISEKLEKIKVLHDIMEFGDPEALRTLLLSILNDYPLTGTYYQREGKEILEKMDSLFKTS